MHRFSSFFLENVALQISSSAKKGFLKNIENCARETAFCKGMPITQHQIWLETIQAERMTKAFPPLQHFSSPAFPSPRTPQSSLTCHKTYTFTPLMIMG